MSAECLPGLVCVHVARGGAPALLVAHGEPAHPGDSGWEVACGAPSHEDEELLVVDVADYLPPALASLPPGQIATRDHTGLPWLVEPIPADEAA